MNRQTEFIKRNFGVFVFIIGILALAVQPGEIITFPKIYNVLNQNSFIITASIGMAVLMISGSMDISLGTQISLIAILCARMLSEKHINAVVVIITAVFIGIALNLFHMFLSVWWNLPNLVISIGTMTLYQGIVDLIGTSRAVLIYDRTLIFLGTGNIAYLSVQFIIAIIIFFAAFVILNGTYLGQYIYAVGSNNKAARLSGINIVSVKAAVSIFYGITVAISSLLHLSRLGSAQTGMGSEATVIVITAVLLGGISIKGGTGKITNVLFIMLLLSWVQYCILTTSYGAHCRNLISGALLLFALGVDYIRGRKKRI